MQGIRLVFSIMLVVAGIVGVPRISAQFCNGNFLDIQRQCERYYKPEGPIMDPSPACCNTLKNVDIPCMCKMAANFQSEFSGEKVVHCLRYCRGKESVPPGQRCGDYTATSRLV